MDTLLASNQAYRARYPARAPKAGTENHTSTAVLRERCWFRASYAVCGPRQPPERAAFVRERECLGKLRRGRGGSNPTLVENRFESCVPALAVKAQLEEQWAFNPLAEGSSPSGGMAAITQRQSRGLLIL